MICGVLSEAPSMSKKAPNITYLYMQLKCLLSATGNQKWCKLIQCVRLCTDSECSHNKHLNSAIKSLHAHLFAFSHLFIIQVHNPQISALCFKTLWLGNELRNNLVNLRKYVVDQLTCIL